jgi:hypothetical protein
MLFLASEAGDIAAFAAVIGAFAVPIIAIIAGVIHSTAKTRYREETKRELAAYVAEGTLRPEDAERILRANGPDDELEKLKRDLADRITRGKIDAEEAEKIFKALRTGWPASV